MTPEFQSDQDANDRLRSAYESEGGARSVFSSRVADYVRARPDYPQALFDELATSCRLAEGSMVADVGGGTGLLSKGLLQQGYRVIVVEPNSEMRQAADRLLGGNKRYRSVAGSAEAMPLEPALTDLVTAAQAFHWFEVQRARTEFLRVLRPQGQVAVIWNDRVPGDPVNLALDEISTEFGGAKRAALFAHEKELSDVEWFFGAAQPAQFSWPHRQILDEEGLMALVFSRSYIPKRATIDGQKVASRVGDIFRRFMTNGTIEIPYHTVAFIGRPAG
ncbi:MAG TPA: class I SAM-dependent methyltransferase [Candidatus Acidoferrum sp.]|jgi:SAM-dependent methyltransferase|nr:class I SAM-dependent methyltransferase [Candidatus Acidoferrum sp.]